ncbi:hypothetical protein DPMN_114918 [Dreissena polymorpha]|uniref:B box-type domain-containing protein n=1 Tax=Dreissena polymorpha TaxID=45954 RepID=A0A9D4QS70_DREPO|nr:hypothetical protein DPMN_114918 [Dreissena polymorpha]
MSIDIPWKPECKNHPRQTAQILCRDHHDIVCIQCYLDNHKACDSIDIHDPRKVKSKYCKLAIELIVLKDTVVKKLAVRDFLIKQVEIEKNKLCALMNDKFLLLVGKLKMSKDNSLTEMQMQFDERLRVARKAKVMLAGYTERLKDGGMSKRESIERFYRNDSAGEIPKARFSLSKPLHDILMAKDPFYGSYHLHVVSPLRRN